MKLRKQLAKFFAGVLTCALLVAPVTAHAAIGDIIDASETCAVSLVYKDRNGKGISGMNVKMYQIASVSGEVLSDDSYTAKYALTPAFAQYAPGGKYPVTGFSEEALNEALHVILSKDERAARWKNFAETLAPYAEADLTPEAAKQTQTDGTLSFDGLQPGLYLLIAEGAVVKEETADYKYSYIPTVVTLPQFAQGSWVYGADADFDAGAAIHPKCSYEEIPHEEYEYAIYKRWVGDDASLQAAVQPVTLDAAGAADAVQTVLQRPVSIAVDIYRDGRLYERVELNEQNNWRYDWKSLSAHRWYAVERTTNTGYSVSMNVTGREITFTNTYTPPSEPPGYVPPPRRETPPPTPEREVLGARRPEPTPTPTVQEQPEVLGVRRQREGEAVLGSRRLPQSGQLWWPVPVLAIAGVVLFAAGAAKRRREE